MPDTAVFVPPEQGADLQDAAATWRACFHGWPQAIPQSGVVVTCYDEQIPFCGFMVSDVSVFLERRNPDSIGARAVILPFANISALKITDVVDSKKFRSLGFDPVVSG